MSEAVVHVKLEEGRGGGRIARVTVDNARRLNCLSTVLNVRLAEAFATVAEDKEVRAVVLTGAGERAFIGGADLNELGGLCADSARLYITRLHQACAAIRHCPLPVIGRINGFCLGAGLEVAASCDFRAAADTAQFGMPEVHMGLPSVIEAALLPGLIGWGRTREMLLTGAIYSAAEALAMGFVQKVAAPADLDAVIDSWLSGVCRATPEAIRSQKALMNRWQRVSVEEGIYAGIDALSDAYKTGEPQAAIAAFFAAKARKTR
jgi:enoyl-CoA hydratase/carnithine racemase